MPHPVIPVSLRYSCEFFRSWCPQYRFVRNNYLSCPYALPFQCCHSNRCRRFSWSNGRNST